MEFPFIYGAQYYRAPTPDIRFWEHDLCRMAENGFNHVKYWAQWRYSHRAPDAYVFDDLDRLMDLAAENGLGVTINVIYDVGPSWVFREYPDCKMVTANGQIVEPRAVICRQIGGYPGPCFNHSEARDARMAFTRAVVGRYADHPAMSMWDIWNEPESCLLFRKPHEHTLLCYCPNCRRAFLEWLKAKYSSIDSLNRVWGRCYGDWDDVELPRDRSTFTDMIDWRLFCLDTLALEASSRISLAKSIDSEHPVYLHPVPNTLDAFNTMTCVDDFQLAEYCDCFAGTTNGVPIQPLQTTAAANGRVCYNVESHLRAGSTGMYPKTLSVQDFADAFIPQIGLGIRGFLHWQYRAETLGMESPAWGLLDVDGSEGTTYKAASEFWERIRPVADLLLQASPDSAQVAIFKSSSNDVFNWCMNGNLSELQSGIDGYTRLLYKKNVQLTYVNDRMLVDGLPASVRLLIMPGCYALDQRTADALAVWVAAGGTLLCEAHTGAYNLTTGRHEIEIPGLGLASAFGLREVGATAVPHLGIAGDADLTEALPDDVLKAIAAFGIAGGDLLPLEMRNGERFWGCSRYAEVAGDDLEPIASRPGCGPCVGIKKVDGGRVVYIGTLAGAMYEKGNPGLSTLVDQALELCGIQRLCGIPDGVRIDRLHADDIDIMAVSNSTGGVAHIKVPCVESMVGLFSEQIIQPQSELMLMPGQADLLVPEAIRRNWQP